MKYKENDLLTAMMFRRGLALLGLLMVFALPAAAQRGNDDGEYRILQARYGTAENNVDVTQRLKELARQDRRFKLVNELFNVDPAPRQRKTLRIYAQGRDGQPRTFEYAEYSEVDGSQFTGWGGGNWGQANGGGSWSGGQDGRVEQDGANPDEGEFQILQARYGTTQRNVDVTQRLKQLARADRSFRMGNDTFGTDPDPGQRKTLRVYARDRSGQIQNFDYVEGSVVDGAQFIGWRSGKWGQGGSNRGWQGDSGLEIISASYGVGNRRQDVTERLREQIRGDRLSVSVNNSLAGRDPAPRRLKTLTVSYRLGGQTLEVRVPEHQTLSLP